MGRVCLDKNPWRTEFTEYDRGTLNTGQSRDGYISTVFDDFDTSTFDTYSLHLIKGLTYNFEISSDPDAGGILAPFLDIRDSAGQNYASGKSDVAGQSALVTGYTAHSTGTFSLETTIFLTDYGTYKISASEGLGSASADKIVGTSFADAINAAGGNDTVLGGNGNDALKGCSGNDVLTGGKGADILVGGQGSDRFDFNSIAESGPSAHDVIRAGDGATAFQGAGAASGDRIDLYHIDADALAAGSQHFVFGGTGRGHVWLTDSGSKTILHGNVDNDHADEFQLVIEDSGVHASAYTATDFISRLLKKCRGRL